RSSIACSYKVRILSYKTTDLLHWKAWCRAVGERLLNESLDPEEVLRGTLVPELVHERPKKVPIAVEWPNIFYKEPEQVFSFQINGSTVYRHDADLILVEPTDNGPLTFAISSNAACACFEFRLVETDGAQAYSI